IHLTEGSFEYQVIPDRTRPLDLEVHTVTAVEGLGTSSDVRREFTPFYSASERMLRTEGAAHYTVHRQPTITSSRQRRAGPRSNYVGSEVFLSLVDGQDGPFRSDLRQLSVDALCTNRDLPLYMPLAVGRTDFHLETGAPVSSVRCLAGPTAPTPSQAWGGTSWRLISHLSLNYTSLTNSDDGSGASALRSMLQLYGDLADAHVRRQIEGVRSINSA